MDIRCWSLDIKLRVTGSVWGDKAEKHNSKTSNQRVNQKGWVGGYTSPETPHPMSRALGSADGSWVHGVTEPHVIMAITCHHISTEFIKA